MAIWKYIKFSNGYIPIYESNSTFYALTLYEWQLVINLKSSNMNNYSIGSIIYECTFENGNYLRIIKYSSTRVRYSWYRADNTLFNYREQQIGGTYPYSSLAYYHDLENNYIGWAIGADRRLDEMDTISYGCPGVSSFKSDLPISGLSARVDYTDFFDGCIFDKIPTDPYSPGGNTETGGGEGDFDGTSDPIDFPDLPQISSSDAGFITLFNPTLTELRDLASFMWTNPLFDLENWRKLFADPMQAVLGLSIVPVVVPDGGQKVVKVGNISTGISLNVAASQYVIVDCGTLNVNEFWGAYLDYDPYTKVEIYLPYIGTHALSADDIMGKAVHVKYHVDILSGACCAYVKCGDSVLYSFVGQCSSSLPVTGNDYTNVINGILSISASVGTMVATGGLTAAPAVTGAGLASASAFVASTGREVLSSKSSVERSGSMAGTGGLLGVQKPYIILTRPRQALPSKQNVFSGYPSFITTKLSELEGYTEIYSIHLENIPATDGELNEIENILRGGVIF